MSKIILHIDFNSYFASVEQQANPFLRNKPIAVAGKGKGSLGIYKKINKPVNTKEQSLQRTVITTASIEAKKRGVKTAMASTEALRTCPELIIIPSDPRKYSDITDRFIKILHRYADKVEQFSCDEAFVDITTAASDYFGATFIAQMIRNDIKNECGKTCGVSIGIASNKPVAKLASESCKPNGLTVIRPEHARVFLDSQPLSAVCGIGKRVDDKLTHMGVTDMQSLRDLPLHRLFSEFNSYGQFLYDIARGNGIDTLQEKQKTKSIGNSYTFPQNLIEDVDIRKQLLALCDRVSARMRKQSKIGQHIAVYARYGVGGSISASKKFTSTFNNGLDIYKNAWHLLDQVRDPNIAIRLLGVSISHFTDSQRTPSSLLEKHNSEQDALIALDTLQEKYGPGVWSRGSTMNTYFKERTSGWHYDHQS